MSKYNHRPLVYDQILGVRRGGDTLCTPSPEQLLLLPTTYLRMFLKDSLMTPAPHYPLEASFAVTLLPIHACPMQIKILIVHLSRHDTQLNNHYIHCK